MRTDAGFAVPLVIAVTGHRDLRTNEIVAIRAAVRSFLLHLRSRYPDRPLRVLSPLAAGADQLVAEEALKLDVDLVVPLPMPRHLYVEDFDSNSSSQNFERLLAQASEVYELPLAKDLSSEEIASPGAARNQQYSQLGVFLCAHCHVLLALWDGKPGGELGGTAQVVKFHHDDVMPGYVMSSAATQQMLVDDESDLIYHIVCSRDRENGAPHADLMPLDACWFTKDRVAPRSCELPAQHQRIFAYGAEFSRDARRFHSSIKEEGYDLFRSEDRDELPQGVAGINSLFRTADWLAVHYQRKVMRALRIGHVLAFLMGFCFILYSDYGTEPEFMLAFLLFFAAAFALQRVARKRAWHRKYLDYRALAEGLRVQFYWAVAGVRNDSASKFAHDNFLQTQDPELGWIRNIMRVAGTHCDAMPGVSPAGLVYVLREWIGDDDSGQLGYFRKKTLEKIRRHRLTERLGNLSLVASVVVVVSLVVSGDSMPEQWIDPLMLVMGFLLLVYGIRQGYAYAIAEKELIKQYEFMLRTFSNAQRRIEQAGDEQEQRQVLKALGGSALDEHAEWILMHRDRSVEQSEIWRPG